MEALVRRETGMRVVDLGCGKGGPGLWVARELGVRLMGIDIVAEAIEQVTVPAPPTAGVVQVQAPPGPVSLALTNVRPTGKGSDSDALVAVPVVTVSAIE